MTQATELLARRMIDLERFAMDAERVQRYTRADQLWRERDDVRHERSLLMRQLWRHDPFGRETMLAVAPYAAN